MDAYGAPHAGKETSMEKYARRRSQVRQGEPHGYINPCPWGEGAGSGGADPAEAQSNVHDQCLSQPPTKGDNAHAEAACEEPPLVHQAAPASFRYLGAVEEIEDVQAMISKKMRAAIEAYPITDEDLVKAEQHTANPSDDGKAGSSTDKSGPTAGNLDLPEEKSEPTAGETVKYHIAPINDYAWSLLKAMEDHEVLYGRTPCDTLMLMTTLTRMSKECGPHIRNRCQGILQQITSHEELACMITHFAVAKAKKGDCCMIRILLPENSPIYNMLPSIKDYIQKNGGKQSSASYAQLWKQERAYSWRTQERAYSWHGWHAWSAWNTGGWKRDRDWQ